MARSNDFRKTIIYFIYEIRVCYDVNETFVFIKFLYLCWENDVRVIIKREVNILIIFVENIRRLFSVSSIYMEIVTKVIVSANNNTNKGNITKYEKRFSK